MKRRARHRANDPKAAAKSTAPLPKGWLLASDGAWRLSPQGAAIHDETRTAVIADLHLGYEWARASGGDVVPPHSLRETTARLKRLLFQAEVARLIVAGDLVESRARCVRTSHDVRRLIDWLAKRDVELVVLRGNHDPPTRPPRTESIELDGWTIAHGDRPIFAPRQVVGHLHPAIRLGGLIAPCFLHSPNRIVLPAFSTNAAGYDVGSGRLPPGLDASAEALHVAAGLGEELLDFGPLASLLERSRRLV